MPCMAGDSYYSAICGDEETKFDDGLSYKPTLEAVSLMLLLVVNFGEKVAGGRRSPTSEV